MASSFDPTELLKNMTTSPGVYQMLDAEGEILYVGKARNLKKRVSQYFQRTAKDAKTMRMVSLICDVKLILTASNKEALILESNLIKQHRPKYNILLRDDKSYPFIMVSKHHDFPRLDIYRGRQRKDAQYFGPYPSAGAVRETLNLLQKLFKIRQCRDSYFKARTRPCLQYQIKRCSAPCVDYISKPDYAESINHAVLFLQGKNQAILKDITEKMSQAAEALQYEAAAYYRDLIKHIREIQDQQYVSSSEGDVDVIAVAVHQQRACVHVLLIRSGRILGSKPFYPKTPGEVKADEVLSAFITQYYSNQVRQHEIPSSIIISAEVSEQDYLEDTLSDYAERKVRIRSSVRGERAKWLQMSLRNAETALSSYLASSNTLHQRFTALRDDLSLDAIPNRLECFDISHSSGEATMASCVVFDSNGPLKSDYRRFNIKDVPAGDDYAAMRQAMLRRYTRLKTGEGALPDVLFVDGGKGQLKQAIEVLEDCQVSGVTLVGIAKGEKRKAEFDHLFLARDGSIHELSISQPAMQLIQSIRDEAHRFAITGHRQKRDKKRQTSVLEDIDGVGQKRRQQLLTHFGGLQGLKNASVEAIATVPGISKALAERIYEHFH